MGYNIIDIINKSMDISKRRKNIYINIGKEKSDIPSIKIISVVLVKEIDRTLDFYEKLKKEISDKEFEEIDFDIYDKISFLINEFNNKIIVNEVSNTKEFLELSLSLEKDVHSLLMNIQGRLVKNTSDINSETYKILSDIIKYKAKHIETLGKTIKG